MNAEIPGPEPTIAVASESLVSIVMPAYNSERFAEEAIASIQSQTHEEWQLAVVDDGSTDATCTIVERLARTDCRIRLIRAGRRTGPGPARNLGMEGAQGRYLAFLDSDDVWLSKKLERQIMCMRERDAAFSTCGYAVVDPSGCAIGAPIYPPASLDYRGLLKNTVISPTLAMLDRRKVGAVCMPALPQHEDLVMWLGILKRGWLVHGIREVLARYRVVPGSASRDKWVSARRMWRVYREFEDLGLLDAAWCYAHYAWRAYRKHRGVQLR